GADRHRARAHPRDGRSPGDRAGDRQVDRPARSLAEAGHHPPRRRARRSSARVTRRRSTPSRPSRAVSRARMSVRHFTSVADVTRVVSRMVDVVVLRTNSHETIEEFARCATVPVINGLSDLSHPCQGLADILTIVEHKGPELGDRVVAYVGDGNNVLHSLMLA